MKFINLNIDFARKEDGRWIADVIDRSGVMAYGTTREQALVAVKALALRVLADQLEHDELYADLTLLHFRR